MPGRLGEAVDSCFSDFESAMWMEFGSAYGTNLTPRSITRVPNDTSVTIVSPDQLAEPLVRNLTGCVLTRTGAPAPIATARATQPTPMPTSGGRVWVSVGPVIRWPVLASSSSS